jgi:pimeloyl-ACP methyl ester carboxylesterase
MVALAPILEGVLDSNGHLGDARIISIVGPNPRKGTFHATPNFLSHDTDRRALHLLPGSGAERRSHHTFMHGLPSSSRMFQPLLTRLADNYHLVAPDYPGYGHSEWPEPKQFDYTFDHIASVIDDFTQALGLSHYTFYMQDYGGPVGFRMALAHPERVQALIVQDAVAHNEGLGANWATRRAFWADRPAHEEALRKNLLSLATTKTRHLGDDPKIELYDPDLWTDEYAFLNAPGQAQIQSDLFYDYRTNVDAYPKWQAWLQKTQPKLLVLWGKHDLSFDPGEPERYRQDVPKAEVYVLDAGHFALDTKAEEIAALVREFTAKEVPQNQ